MRPLLLLVGNLSPLMTGLLTAPITARALQADGRGQITQVLLVATAIQVIATLGLPWLSRTAVATEPRSSRSWARVGLMVGVPCMPLALAVCLPPTVGQLGLSPEQMILTASIFAVSSFSAYRGTRGNTLLSLGRPELFGLVVSVGSLILLGAVVGLAALRELDLSTLLYANLIVLVVQLSLVAGLARRVECRSQLPGTPRIDPRALTRPWLAQVSEFTLTRVDLILLVLVGNVPVLGVYSLVALVPQALYAACQSVVQLSYSPARYGVGPRRHAHIAHASLLIGLVTAGLAVPTILFLFPVLFGPSFSAAAEFIPAVVVMCLAVAGLAPAIARGADGSKSIFLLAGLSVGALGVALVVSSIAPIQQAVLLLGALVGALAWTFVVLADPRSLATLRIKELILWLRGR